MTIGPLLGWIAFALVTGFLLLFVIVSLREGEKRAAGRATIALLAVGSAPALTGFIVEAGG